MSVNINGSDRQTLLDATQGLGFVEGDYSHVRTYSFTSLDSLS